MATLLSSPPPSLTPLGEFAENSLTSTTHPPPTPNSSMATENLQLAWFEVCPGDFSTAFALVANYDLGND